MNFKNQRSRCFLVPAQQKLHQSSTHTQNEHVHYPHTNSMQVDMVRHCSERYTQRMDELGFHLERERNRQYVEDADLPLMTVPL